ncbi:DUF2304 domain-containing protein [Clostridium polynesiense]|uniref:DUF2304 domain-containing protein n=1 Tax=Clostridium polynesiense TaxID=1325933 RepID=UPI00058EAED9|nr:DUF2304 domain-containing protein [Clostridium polynesiense]
MDRVLQLMLIAAAILFAIYIIAMVNRRKLQLKYTLTWLLVSVIFILISIFPKLVFTFSRILHIVEPVNALYFIIISFLLIIVFTLTRAVSNYSTKVKDLTQELGILKNYLENQESHK